MSGSIFLKEKTGLIEMREQAYDSEDLLQGYLESHPSLLAGDQIGGDEPRRWLLVRRESSVPGEEGGSGRWSLDHLFLDQEGVPTLVEVKRSTDTRIRREVVGQMLDYAANAVAYWSIEKVIAELETTCQQNGQMPDEALREFLSDEMDAEAFWKDVETNLEIGRIRMVFVSDRIPKELRRIVEFLNEQMEHAEMLALEVKQFVGEGLTTFVPRIIGQTEAAKRKKAPGGRSERIWEEESFLEELESKGMSLEVGVAKQIIDRAPLLNLHLQWGKGVATGLCGLHYEHGGVIHRFFFLSTTGDLKLRYHFLRDTSPLFASEAARRELQSRLAEIPGANVADKIEGEDSIRLDVFKEEQSLETLFDVMRWFVAKIRTFDEA